MADANGKRITAVQNGQWVNLGMEYDVNIPQYSSTRSVEVTEYNTLIASDGRKMDNAALTRRVHRVCEGVKSGVEVKIPENLPEGRYTHLASLTVEGKKYEKKQYLQIARADHADNREVFAFVAP